jgi:hypothetical protein
LRSGGLGRLSVAALGDHADGGCTPHRERNGSEGAGAAWRQREPVAASHEVCEPGRERQHEGPPRHRGRLELDPQRAARSEQQHLDGSDRRVEAARDLVVGEARDLAEQEDLTLRRRQRSDGAEKGVCLLVTPLERRHRVGIDRLLARTSSGGAKASAPDVLRNGEQPRPRRVGPRAAQKCTVGVDKCRLSDVLGILHVSQLPQRGDVDSAAMPLVEALEGPVRFRA